MPQPTAILVRFGRYRSTMLGALLVVALAVTGVVTYQAYRASRNYKQIVERVLHDYVATATYQYSQNVSTAVDGCVKILFSDLTDPAIGKISNTNLLQCGNQNSDYFEYDFARNEITRSSSNSAELIDAIKRAAIRPDLAHTRYQWYSGVSLTPTSELVAFIVKRDGQGQAVRLAGVVTKGMLEVVGPAVMQSAKLLSPELADGIGNEAWHGSIIPTNQPIKPEELTARATLVVPWDGLSVEVKLEPTALSAIVPNGIPEDNGYRFIGLFILALGLVTSAVLLLRRESQLARARASFVSSVSHELRTPLAQIRMFAEMLLLGRARTEAEQRRSAEIIENEAKRLSHLVENVLQAARSERGTVVINPTDARFAPVIRDAAESFMGLAEGKHIDFRLELQENLTVSADADAIRHIVLNLLDNAVKYGPTGQRVVIGFALFEDAARLWVDDEGPGVPTREREKVFQAFYRSQRDLHSSTAGSGIGLAIVRELAALHGGSAWIEDAPQQGARVVVEFPGAYVAAEQPAGSWAVA
ncbi:MAG TPA: HAMP domain-containing sensor histidine kinase [Longimicrobiales bacterium]|nr:HAMP domain-containing sensor histidine kinase [Longimicrobiales bacterium]